ncbi:hypothetical protein FVE85_8895 [Porphyridium purpureum]|uniref:Uncharacterized protein n=1 Tax=Porphyridium purpureum TaxID=35688 RepID=A0A5J4YR92_PORPP|nr:hypothetical protein FVE85_8895 [Porphyridium purpureum]|eukprot:POR2583..scf296_7
MAGGVPAQVSAVSSMPAVRGFAGGSPPETLSAACVARDALGMHSDTLTQAQAHTQMDYVVLDAGAWIGADELLGFRVESVDVQAGNAAADGGTPAGWV